MKKFLLGLIAAVCVAFGASAQHTELQIGYGGYTQMDATDMHNGGKINTAWGALTAGVNFKLAPKLWVGPSYSFSSSSYKNSPVNIYYHVIMLNGRYEYYRNSIVKLYGHMGLGVDISHMAYDGLKENKGYFAYQFSPLGAQVDLARGISMFGELGFGAQGLLQVGVRFGI
ncbi:MAG: outer membrane beta-barrel protein [Bacteroides sp.]|nr:outer membrane beta-barrel protein [Bacteroides sp.]